MGITQKDIDRINYLAKKKKTEGLTEAEAAEQTVLRQRYIAAFRENLRGQLERIDILEKDGTVTRVVDQRRVKDRENKE